MPDSQVQIGRPRTVDRAAECSTEGCGRLVEHGNGMCHACYQLWRKRGSVERRKRESNLAGIVCVTPDCGRSAQYSSGLCGRCYQRERIEEERQRRAQEAASRPIQLTDRQVLNIRSSAWNRYAHVFYDRTTHYDEELDMEAGSMPPRQWRAYFLQNGDLPRIAETSDRELIAGFIADATENLLQLHAAKDEEVDYSAGRAWKP
jgi:hypothetical protein